MPSELRRILGIAPIVTVVAFSACGGTEEGGDASNAGAGGSGAASGGAGAAAGAAGVISDASTGGGFIDSSLGDDAGGSDAEEPDADATCGATAITIEAIPPDMLVVFDRSCSMRRFYDSNEPVFGYGPTDPKTRWAMAVNALDGIMAQYENRIRFGLMVFPRPYQGCGDLPNVNLLPAITNRSQVLQKLDQLHPFDICQTGQQPTETPTAEALSAVLNEGVFDPAVREGYVLLMTDGMATCGASASGLAQLVSSIRSAGAKTAVVGFGETDLPQAASMLDAMGQAGGVKTDAPHYWYAENPTSLGAAVGAIVQNAVSCTFKLDEPPPDPDKIYAYFDGQQVPADATDGWTYDPVTQTILFNGTSCQSLQSGNVKNVSVVFGCPDSTCKPSDEVCDGYDNDCDDIVDEGCVQ